jgi:hypothetical protein
MRFSMADFLHPKNPSGPLIHNLKWFEYKFEFAQIFYYIGHYAHAQCTHIVTTRELSMSIQSAQEL